MEDNQKITTNHEEIKQWIKLHGGRPAIVGAFNAGMRRIGLKIEFHIKEDLELLGESVSAKLISWDTFFDIFDKKHLAFIYENQRRYNDITMAYRFINKDYIPI